MIDNYKNTDTKILSLAEEADRQYLFMEKF